MKPWQEQPLGFAIVDETDNGNLTIHHVSMHEEGIFASGLWVLLPTVPKDEVQDLITHQIVVGTPDGSVALTMSLGKKVKSADLSGLIAAGEAEESRLQAEWKQYRDNEPKKRSNLKPLWVGNRPPIQEYGDAKKLKMILQRIRLMAIAFLLVFSFMAPAAAQVVAPMPGDVTKCEPARKELKKAKQSGNKGKIKYYKKQIKKHCPISSLTLTVKP